MKPANWAFGSPMEVSLETSVTWLAINPSGFS